MVAGVLLPTSEVRVGQRDSTGAPAGQGGPQGMGGSILLIDAFTRGSQVSATPAKRVNGPHREPSQTPLMWRDSAQRWAALGSSKPPPLRALTAPRAQGPRGPRSQPRGYFGLARRARHQSGGEGGGRRRRSTPRPPVFSRSLGPIGPPRPRRPTAQGAHAPFPPAGTAGPGGPGIRAAGGRHARGAPSVPLPAVLLCSVTGSESRDSTRSFLSSCAGI